MNATRFNLNRFVSLLVTVFLVMVTFAPAVPPAAAAPARADKISALAFRNEMRKLWEDHITWTRLYIISVAADLPDKDLTAQRLLQNQTDIGNAVKPFYGDAAGDKLTALLKDHILGAADLLAAAKTGDTAKVNAASAKWYANADDIATFLNSANPKAWLLADMKAGMKMHLDMTLAEATARLKGDYAADIKDYDQVHEHILGLADTLGKGIINQFPDNFDQSTLVQFPLQSAMRKLWEDHVTWTRLYIVSVAADLPDKNLTAQRLLQNQADIGNAIKPFYGGAAGDKLTALLKDHIVGAADLLAAAKAGDKAKVDAASAKWYANADDIAAFLNTANPKAWPLDAMIDGMKMHLDLTLDEATNRLQGNYAADINAYDKVHQHILGLADTLSQGIASQFPQRVAPATLPATGAADGRLPDMLLALIAGSGLVVLGWFIRKIRTENKQ